MEHSITPPHRQRTIRMPVFFCGKGLHSGKRARVSLFPAPPDTGVQFVRTDPAGCFDHIPARITHAVKRNRCSGLVGPRGGRVQTCEHLLAALAAAEIDNIAIHMDNEEVPILDGSAALFDQLLQLAGAIEQDAPRRYIKVLCSLEVRDGDRFVRLDPSDTPTISLTLSLRGFPILSHAGDLAPATIRRDIVAARTFAPARQALPMAFLSRLTGMRVARGANMANLLLHHKGRILNPEGFRIPDELARHRVLDILGDLALAGAPVLAKITAHRSSHSLNQDLVRLLMDSPEAHAVTTSL